MLQARALLQKLLFQVLVRLKREYEGLGIREQKEAELFGSKHYRVLQMGNSKVHPYYLSLFMLRHKSQSKGLELELTLKK